MGRAEVDGSDCAGKQLVICPLVVVGIVTQKGDRDVVLVEYRDPSFQFGNYGVVTPKTHLAGTTQMEGEVGYEFAIEIVMTETTVFPVAYQQERLIVTRVHSQPVAAVAHAVGFSLARIGRLIITRLFELENAGITIPIRDVDGTVRAGHSCG